MSIFLLPPELPHIDAALRDAASGAPESRWVAALALGRVRGARAAEAIAALAALAADPLEEIRAQAVEGIAEQSRGGGGAPDGLVPAALRDPSAAVRCAAVDAAAAIDASPGETVAPLLLDDDASVRAAAASALGDLGAKEHVPRIASLLDDPDALVRSCAAVALASLGDPRGAPILVAALEDRGWDAVDAALALGSLAAPEHVAPLRRVLTSRFAPIALKAMAAAAAARCGDPAGRAELSSLLGSRRQDRRMIAVTTLARLPVAGLTDAVGRLLDGNDETEVSAAIRALAALAVCDWTAARETLAAHRGRLEGDLGAEIDEALVDVDQIRV